MVIIVGMSEFVCAIIMCEQYRTHTHRKPTLRNDMDIDFVWFNQQ